MANKKIIKNLEELFSNTLGIRDVRTREEIPGATYDISFTHPLAGLNRNNWVECSYFEDEERLFIGVNGESIKLPNAITDILSQKLSGSKYNNTLNIYEWRNVQSEKILNLNKKNI